ncbi:MAG TPA: cytochrome c3 family protein [Vicinamibacteria bacterium]
MTRRSLVVVLVVLCLASVIALRAQTTKDQPHGDIAMDCGECHTSERWNVVEKTKFQHDSTGFPLEAAHAKTSCRSCHDTLVFNRVGTACADCHKDAHRGELGFRCEGCHTPKTWANQNEMFRAHNRSRFPLFATHATLDCQACHRNQQPFEYANTPAQCGSCHLSTYDRTTNPNHAQAGFSRRCEDCHSVTAPDWHGSPFSHPASFPLQGGHAGITCARCHSSGVFTGLSRECYSCHQKDYVRTTNPNHQSGGFPTQCQSCHNINAWKPANFDHGITRFPLTGAHLRTDCAKCHVGGQYAGTATSCVACHRADYNRTTNPNHQTGGFPTSCETCHNTGAWRPANFDHNRGRFPLTGAHQRVDCARCHVGGRYAGTPTACVSCHQADYNRTNNPNHQAAGFPTQCQECHTTTAWKPASFDHDGRYFPIYSGKHRGKWGSCSECHVNPSNYKAFECIRCHEHSNKAEVDGDHRGVSGYQYTSAACYRCHSRGSADAAGRVRRLLR